MKKLYKYVGIMVVGLVVLIIIINLFHLNTKVIEGLTIKEVKLQKKQEEEEIENQEGTPLEKILSKLTKNNDFLDNFIKPYMDDKEVTEDILLELDEICDKAILWFTMAIGGDGEIDLSKKGFDKSSFEDIERLMSFKKAINQCMKFVTNSELSGNSSNGITGGIFS